MKEKEHISLEEIDRKLPFSVPENYFENFAVRMDEQINTTRTERRIPLYKIWASVAAALVGVFVLSQVYFNFSTQKNIAKTKTENYEQYVLSQVDEASLFDYYMENAKDNE